MRYLVAFVIGIGALFGVNSFTGIFSMPRPWNSLSMGATVGITMVVVLLIWEVVKPSNKDAAPAKPAMSEEERAKARAERRSRLAAEAGVSLDDTKSDDTKSDDTKSDDTKSGDTESDDTVTVSKAAGQTAVPEAKPADEAPVAAAPPMHSAREDETSPEADESSIEAEPEDGDDSLDQLDESDVAQDEPETIDEPETLAPDEYDEQAAGSSLESPPTGEPGISVDSLEDAESADTDGASDDDPVDDDSTAVEPNSKR